MRTLHRLSLALCFVSAAAAVLLAGKYIEQSIVVKPGSHSWFVLESTADGARFQGRFRAQGGSGNDITCFILDEDGFENYSNGHSTPAFYNSGKVTVGRFDVRLPPGKYYLVFDNHGSAFSNKVVAVDVNVDR